MKIYITGVSGLLGGNLAYLLKDRAEIFGCDRNRILIPGLLLNIFDCLDIQRLRQDIESVRPDVLIHCVGMTSVDGCEKDPEAAYRINTWLAAETARICRDLEIKMVFLSSDAVYDGNALGLHRENEKTVSCNVYGHSKIMAEDQILKLERLQETLILRTNFVGYNIRNRTGFFEWLLGSMISGTPVTLFEDVWFSPLSITALTEIIWNSICKGLSGIFNASSTKAVTKLEFGNLVKECFGLSEAVIVPGKVEDAHLAARRSLNMGMDNTGIADALGISPDTPEETIQILYDEYSAGYPQLLRSFREAKEVGQ